MSDHAAEVWMWVIVIVMGLLSGNDGCQRLRGR